MKLFALFGALCFLCASQALALSPGEDLINRSIEVLYELSRSLDRRVLLPLFENAQSIAIFPGVKRAGFFVGIARGEGVVFARGEDRKTFFGPAFYTLQGVNLGIQVGIQSQDIILFIMRRAALEALSRGYVVLGGNLSVTLGPAGRGVSVALDPELSSPCYAYALSRGAFLGVALEGTKLSENPELNEKFWGREVKAATILSQFLPPDFASRNLERFLRDLAEGGENS
ncbi:lipid-binding SYLF domain-containing protein [Candidatus Caldatribacterium saccharofermentans]|uniref:lipid-binding SYLF domain-containing protein n=1 Tax=Candidatus Caldatribacterium saccharofermentans TaxID=1454753 RepID=UPI003D04D00B